MTASLTVGSVHDIKLSHVLNPAEYHAKLLSPRTQALQAKLSQQLTQDHSCWSSFLPAYPSRLVLARSCQTNSWLRAKIISTAMTHIVVQYPDHGHTEVVYDPHGVADLPAGLDFIPLAMQVKLDRFLPQKRFDLKKIEAVLQRLAETEWRMLVKSLKGGSVLVEIFLINDSSYSRLSDLLVCQELGSLTETEPFTGSIPPWAGLAGNRLPVTVCQQAAPHPGNILLTLDEVTQHLQAGLGQGSLSRLAEGLLLAVRVGEKWERARLVQIGLVAKLVLVDSDKQVTVEYSNCADLPASLHSIPSALIRVSLTGLHCIRWSETSTARLSHMLHIHKQSPITPKLFIIVHCMEDTTWEVSLLEEVSRNHQVNIGALLVAEKLAKSRCGQMKVVMGWSEARGADIACFMREKDVLDETDGDDHNVDGKSDGQSSTATSLSRVDCEVKGEYLGRPGAGEPGAGLTVEDVARQDTADRKQTVNINQDSDSGVERGDSASTTDSHLDWQDSDGSNLPDSFTGIITNIEGEAGKVWLVPSAMKGKQKLVNTLLASLSRRLPMPEVGGGGEKLYIGDDVLAWWEEDSCWFRAKVLETHLDLSTTVFFIDWGNTEQLPAGQVVLPKPGLSGYQALSRLPGLAVQARLYGVQMEELEEEGRKKQFIQMSRIQAATGNWHSQAQVTVCRRKPLHVQVQYKDNMLDLNLVGVLVAGRFASIKMITLPLCKSPPPCPLPWQFNHSWPGQVVSRQGDMVWVVPVMFTDQYGLSDRDWYMDRFVQVLAMLHNKLGHKLQDTYKTFRTRGGECGSLAVGETVIWCDEGKQGMCSRGVVRELGENNKVVKIFLPDTGGSKTVASSCLQVCPARLCACPARAVRLKLSSSVSMDLVRMDRVVLVTVLSTDMTAHLRYAEGGSR